ncbi:cell division protein ZipA [Ectothiorhodospiraceae bacterium WFHF3C12]|nr:cell division protein ZipA [Ectothiorhodospiraceae bacterium WFHF3C12]
MDELRWLLLIIGLLLIVGVYAYGRYQDGGEGDGLLATVRGLFQKRRRRNPLHEQRADFDRALDELDSVVASEDREPDIEPLSIEPEDREPAVDEAPRRAAEPRSAPREEPREEPQSEEPPPETHGEEKIVVLNVAAPEGEVFAGPAVFEALESVGLQMGEHDIFHRVLDTRDGRVALFSVANILEPGHFAVDDRDAFETPGLAFFLRLPGPFDGLAAFEQMHASAKAVAEALGGRLLDSRRCNLTAQAVEHIREELIEHRRRAHLAARQAR